MNDALTPGFGPTALMLCVSLAESGPMLVDEFDDAWSPAGDTYRDELVTGGLVRIEPVEEDGPPMIVLTAAGVALASSQGPVTPATAPQA